MPAEPDFMRSYCGTALVAALLLGSSICPASASSPFDFFAGNWECTTAAGSRVFMLYHPVLNNQWLVLEDTFVNAPANVAGEYIEYYRYDRPLHEWWATSLGGDGSLEVANSPDWKDDQLIFEGSVNIPGASGRFREIYTKWKDGITLERAHYQLTRAGWYLYSRSLCHRVKAPGT